VNVVVHPHQLPSWRLRRRRVCWSRCVEIMPAILHERPDPRVHLVEPQTRRLRPPRVPEHLREGGVAVEHLAQFVLHQRGKRGAVGRSSSTSSSAFSSPAPSLGDHAEQDAVDIADVQEVQCHPRDGLLSRRTLPETFPTSWALTPELDHLLRSAATTLSMTRRPSIVSWPHSPRLRGSARSGVAREARHNRVGVLAQKCSAARRSPRRTAPPAGLRLLLDCASAADCVSRSDCSAGAPCDALLGAMGLTSCNRPSRHAREPRGMSGRLSSWPRASRVVDQTRWLGDQKPWECCDSAPRCAPRRIPTRG